MKYTIMNLAGPCVECESYEEADAHVKLWGNYYWIWEGSWQECQIKFNKQFGNL